MKNQKGRPAAGKTRTRRYERMTPAELAEATREFDREDLSEAKPLRGRKRARYERAKARRGRPRIGSGSTAISLSIERRLLTAVDRRAKREHLTRSQLIARALREHLEERLSRTG
jgi:Ribbon-helix-helix protein, copG family